MLVKGWLQGVYGVSPVVVSLVGCGRYGRKKLIRL